MSGKTVDLDSLVQVAQALHVYIESVSTNVEKLRKNAEDCADNMGNDTYSKDAIDMLEACLNDMQSSVVRAQEIEDRIHKEIAHIIEISKEFGDRR